MTIVNTINETKQINYFNRFDLLPVSILITNESTKVKTFIDINSVISLSYYDQINVTFADGYFIQDNFYFLKEI